MSKERSFKNSSGQAKYPNINEFSDLRDFLKKPDSGLQLPGINKKKIMDQHNRTYLTPLAPVINNRLSSRANRPRRKKQRVRNERSALPRPITGVCTYYKVTKGDKNNIRMIKAKNLIKNSTSGNKPYFHCLNDTSCISKKEKDFDAGMGTFSNSYINNREFLKQSLSPTNPGTVRFFTKPQKAKEFDDEFKRHFRKYKLDENKMVQKLSVRFRVKKSRGIRRVVLNKTAL
ncbi:unnamed protein product [Moneuplotes crassus]|uniref:Uncharacterized protein n=1 Tax=Euplotes crassus TaxID=5936 RepID=A0AAD1XUC6_EUPCR|nr:unnamed protein product [Moneuplotes crassus]